MTTALTNAQKELKVLAGRPEIEEAFRKMMGENAAAFIASMLTAVNTNDRLKLCDPMSIVNAAMLAASLDLPIEQNLGQAWMVPYKDKGFDRAQFQIGYKGLIQLALRSGQYKHLNVEAVYNGEIVTPNRMTGGINITGERMNDETIGYYAYIELLNGYSHTVYMTRKEVEEHAKRYSKSFGYDKSPWTTNFDEMAKKTVIRRILTKYGILSVKMSRAITADEKPMSEIDISDIAPKVIEAKATDRKKRSAAMSLQELTGDVPPRPWEPEYIKDRMEQWMIDLRDQPIEEGALQNKHKVIAAVLDKVLTDKTKRYEVCEYLTGKSSTADMREEALALLHWLGVSRFEDVPTDAIRAEIHACHKAALIAKGQMEFSNE